MDSLLTLSSSAWTAARTSNARQCYRPLTAVVSCLTAFALTACGGSDDAPVDPTVANTRSGPVKGIQTNDVVAFKGIPYAAPPVGDLRWRAPQPVSAWTTTRVADKASPNCMQTVTTTSPSVAEDCLYLNVWRPATLNGPLPVMVWVYGGGYTSGGSDRGREDGAQFARQGVILVSFNYRLGRLGFFGHPALSAAAESTGESLGNYGYMDQIAALKWVKDNIASFGGDPNNVTLFGESAGGESIHNLITSPLATGLFHKVINQSGNGRINQAFGRYLRATPGAALPSAEEQGVAFAQQFGITSTGAVGLAALRAMPAGQIIANPAIATFAGGSIIDGKLVPDEPQNLYNSGQFIKVPIMLGTNSADLGFPTAAATKDAAFAVFGAGNLAAARAAFDPDGTQTVDQVRRQIAAVITMHEPARFVARAFTAQGQAAYLYKFSYVADQLKATQSGATHAAEIAYVFNNLDAQYPTGVTAVDRKVAETLQAYWVAFANTGKPLAAGLPAWGTFNTAANNLLEFTAAGQVQMQEPDPLKAQLDLVQPLNERNAVVNTQYGL